MQDISLLINQAESVRNWSEKLLKKAPLTADQRDDVTAINTAANAFIQSATNEMQALQDNPSPETKKRVRHELRNHLNIMIGFSKMIVRELPDNLIMDMVTIRKIKDTGEILREKVDEIQ